MKTGMAALVLGFLVTVWLTPIFRDWALKRNLVDDPREGRRVHSKPIPRIGGIALALGFLAPILGLAIYENDISTLIYEDSRAVVTLMVGAALALGIGLADDLFAPSAKVRLLGLTGVGTLAWLGGHRIDILDVPMVGVVDVGLWSGPLTVLWIVGIIVAFNFIDGLDGLAAGIALIATGTMFLLAFMEKNVLWMTWSGAMAGALAGFLVFNFNPASIFMGDSGSNFLGYMMAVVALGTSRKESTAVAILIPMLALGLPILDTTLTMLRRALLREGMFLSERGHLHHRLLDLGLSHRRSVLALWGITVLLCLAGLTVVSEASLFQVVVGTTLSVVVFALMFATGYLRPVHLRTMWNRGLDNQARDQALAGLTEQLANHTDAEAFNTGTITTVLTRLTEDSGISGAAYRRTNGEMVTVGEYDEEAKGVRAHLEVPGTDGQTVTFLWRGRTSGPTRSEVNSLKKLLLKLTEPGG